MSISLATQYDSALSKVIKANRGKRFTQRYYELMGDALGEYSSYRSNGGKRCIPELDNIMRDIEKMSGRRQMQFNLQ